MKNRLTSILKKFKPAWLLFFTIPALYYFIREEAPVPPQKVFHDYLYFSIRTSRPSTVTLLDGRDSLASWEIKSAGYKYCDYVGNIRNTQGIALKIKGLSEQDNLSFLSVNLYRNQGILTFSAQSAALCSFDNALSNPGSGVLSAVVQRSGEAVRLTTPKISDWQHPDGKRHFYGFIIIVFLIAFVLIMIFAPSTRHFIFSCCITLGAMLLFYWAAKDFQSGLTFRTSAPAGHSEIFYNNTPWPDPAKSVKQDSASASRGIPVDLNVNPFIRCDVDGTSGELSNTNFRIRAGIIFRNLDLNKAPNGQVLMNDLEWKNGRLLICGPDPYFSFTTVKAFNRIQWLLFFRRNLFLFLSVLLLIVLSLLNRLFPLPHSSRLKPAYLLFLAIPVTFYLLMGYFPDRKVKKTKSILYFSVRSSSPSIVSLVQGAKKLADWHIDSLGYHCLEYWGPLTDSGGLFMLIDNLKEKDTFSLLSMHLFRDKRVVSPGRLTTPITGITNLSTSAGSGMADGMVEKTGSPVILKLPAFYPEQYAQPLAVIHLLIIICFLACFLLLILRAPPAGYMVAVTIFTLFTMAVGYWLGLDESYQVVVRSQNTLSGLEVFYNSNPHFIAFKKAANYYESPSIKTEAYISKDPYLRFDVTSKATDISDLGFTIKSGILRCRLDMSSVPPDKMILNNILIRDGKMIVCGPDPYIAVTSDYCLLRIHRLLMMRSVAFLGVALLLFVLLILLHKRLSRLKTVNLLLISSFLFLISGGLLFWPFHSERLIFPTEKRYAMPLMAFETDSVNRYIPKLNAYIEDQLPGRKMMITMNSLVKYKVYRKYYNPYVHFGKDGWMFLIHDYMRDFYENKQPLTVQEMNKLKNIFVTRRDWLLQRGIRFYLVFPCMAQTIYEEYIGPGLYRYNRPAKLDQLLMYLHKNTDLEIIDVKTPIMKAKPKIGEDLYYKTDPHWNFIGAQIAYKAMIDYMRKDFPSIGSPVPLRKMYWAKFNTSNLGYLNMLSLSPNVTSTFWRPYYRQWRAATDTIYKHYPENKATEPELHELNRNSKGPGMLMFYDSFGAFLMPYFSYHFSRCSYFWNPVFLTSVIEKEKPDLVIWEIGEANIFNILKSNEPLSQTADSLKAEIKGTPQ